MGHASKGMLVLRPVHAIGHGLLPFGTQRFAWPPGPSCFDGIRTRITLKGHPIGWKTKPCCGYDAGEAVLFRLLRCRPAP